MRYHSLTICETALIDARSNNISFINLIEEIHAPSFPITIPQITAVALLEKESDKDGEVEALEIVASINDEEILRQPLQANFKNRPRARQILLMPGFPISAPGTLKYSLFHNGKMVMENSIDVKSTQA